MKKVFHVNTPVTINKVQRVKKTLEVNICENADPEQANKVAQLFIRI